MCESVGLNPLTKPFDYIVLNGKLTLYAKKDATDQLRSIHGISVYRLERDVTADTVDVTAYGRDRTGREDASLGSVPITNLKGEALANAKMKAETKAKRRLTLSLAGMGWLDETEVGTIASAQAVVVDEAGEVLPVTPSRPTLAAVVADRLSEPTEATGTAAPAVEAHEGVSAPSVAGEATGEAPVAQDEAPAPPVDNADLMEAAKEIFKDDIAPGITMDELTRMMREKHVPKEQATIIAKRVLWQRRQSGPGHVGCRPSPPLGRHHGRPLRQHSLTR